MRKQIVTVGWALSLALAHTNYPDDGKIDADANGLHAFPKFFFAGSANSADSVLALDINRDGKSDPATLDEEPDVFINGYTVDNNQGRNIRTIKYHEPARPN